MSTKESEYAGELLNKYYDKALALVQDMYDIGLEREEVTTLLTKEIFHFVDSVYGTDLS